MNIGILGTGSIARTMAAEFAKVPAFRCEAVCSRQQTTGEALAQQFGIPKVYTDYDAMLADPDIELVYIATPNSLHYAQTKAALLAGKNVLCEKPFVPTVAEADELIALAKEKHLFLFEAITTAHHPNYALAKQYLDDIGSLRIVSCTFCQYSSRYDSLISGKLPNVFNPEFAGGALMDINLYNIHFLVGLFGKPDRIEYFAGTHENGIDTHGILILQFGDIICQCSGSKNTTCENNVQIMGEKGYIHVSPGSSNCQNSRLILRDSECSFCQKETPWYYEIQELTKIVQSNDYERCYQLLENTEIVVDILEKARKSAHLSF
jgi:predicted dehydrogenase